jgi:putative ABC transport system substrate-binding protein
VVYVSRWADLKSERLPVIARELVEMRPDVVIAFGYLSALAMKTATTTIPIVATAVGDPVATGLVASFARPGANLTGISDQSAELSAKRLELLKEVRPDAGRIAVLWNAGNEAMTQRYREIERAAGALHITVDALAVRDPADFDAAFATMRRAKPDALLVVTDALTNSNQARVLDFAASSSVPAMYEAGPIVRNGGLISYGPRPDDLLRRVAVYVDRILKGAKPADLPVEQSTQFELLINMKTAKSLGVAIPNSVFLRADEVIQ